MTKELVLTGAVRSNRFNAASALWEASLTGRDPQGRVRMFIGAGFDFGDAELRLESMLTSAHVHVLTEKAA